MQELFFFGFLFEWFAFWLALPILALIFLWEGVAYTKSASNMQIKAFFFHTILVLGLVHFSGLFDVWTFATEHTSTALMVLGGYVVIGLLYFIPRGIIFAKGEKRQKEYRSRVVAEKFSWLEQQRSGKEAEMIGSLSRGYYGRYNDKADEDHKNLLARMELPEGDPKRIAPLSDEEQAAWDTHKAEFEASLRDVNKYKGLVFYWIAAWAPDLLYHCVFQFLERLRDAFNLFFKGFRGWLQKIVDSAFKKTTADI